MPREAKIHYMPGNKITWSPPTVVFIKAITTVIPDSDPETLELTGWVATIQIRRDVKAGGWTAKHNRGFTAASLAQWLVENTRGRETVWVFTHDAALDLITTRLPVELHHAGWSVNSASLSGSAPWLRLSRGSRRMAIADSFSWLPHTPADLAERAGSSPPRRAVSESDLDYQTRSARFDLDVVADAMMTLLEWWDKNALGKWSISGPSSGFHAMRHIPNPHKMVIDPDPVGIAADRRAIYGGRRGAWLVGSRSLGPFLELDFSNAYPSVARGLPLPVRRTAAFDHLDLDNWRLTSDRWGIIAQVTLVSDVPRWPVRFPGGTFCPVGEFTTTLCGPEIRDALRLGALRTVGPGITHQLGPYLQPWGEWIIDAIRNTDGDTPEVAQLAAKHWSRNVIGKFASRAYERIDLGPSPERDWHYEEGWDHGTQTRFGTVHMAGEQWQSVVSGDAEQAYPAVFAWVESETRLRLTRVIDAIGEGAVLQCDTDGLIVVERLLGTAAARGQLVARGNQSGAARTRWVLDQLAPLIDPLTIRIKKTHKTIRVLGPQHVHTPGDRKFAGLPKLAVEGAPDVYKYKQWPGLSTQLGLSGTGGYVRPESTVRVTGPYAPGWVLSDGRVIPVQCRIDEAGQNRLVGFHDTDGRPRGSKLAEHQHPVLEALW
jgi:hypothetical protein